jgi:predicted nucleic acid-binding protein
MHRRPRQIPEDAMLAATARLHGLTLVTRNTRDSKGLGLPLLNPFTREP